MAWHQAAPSRLVRCGFATALAVVAFNPANAESLTSKSVEILSRAFAFLQPPPSGTATVAIAYDPAEPASKQDADAIVGHFGDGLKVGPANLKAQVVDISQLASGHFIAVIATTDVNIDRVFSASQALHVPCVTADPAAVRGGRCVMSVQSDLKVEIQINAAAASRSGVAFQSAFMFMVRVN